MVKSIVLTALLIGGSVILGGKFVAVYVLELEERLREKLTKRFVKQPDSKLDPIEKLGVDVDLDYDRDFAKNLELNVRARQAFRNDRVERA